ncbi:MAG TPA: hypothetical protein VMM60_16735 [Ilumatobacter sp.]|nr:hypothetical protein [Ilumatobacter sp.]
MSSDREGQADIHPAAVSLYRRVKERANICELDNGVELLTDGPLAHSEDRSIQVDIFATREFGVKTRTHFEQTADLAVKVDCAGARFRDTAEDFQERALARAVTSDDAQSFADRQIEGHIGKSGELLFATGTQRVTEFAMQKFWQ